MYKASFLPSSQAEVLDSSTDIWVYYVKDIYETALKFLHSGPSVVNESLEEVLT